ncbi:glycoside hydrolase family 24 protein, partial [Crassisporium funariophilum]
NDATIALIKQFEGFVASPKPDPIGLATAGFGHKCVKANCAEVPFSFPLSQATATTLLATDAQKFVTCLHGLVKNVPLNDNQFGALTAFAFNLGCGTVQSSTLLKRLNAGEDPNTVAAAEIPKFNKAGGKVLAGLTRRRAAEVALFQTASDTIAHPLC